jgi:copper homeostasis protein
VSTRYLLEIACNSATSAVAAQEGGADRVELFENLEHGGTTPSMGTIAVARDRLRIPLFVLIRPRPGDFLYSELEAEIMLRDIEQCRQRGCDGVVIGALTADAEIDMALCRQMVAAAGPLGITFHRAFDATGDLSNALDQVIALGAHRILSSGGCTSAVDGSPVLASLVAKAGSHITLMAGAGLNAGNIGDVARRSGCRELHASAKSIRHSIMRYQNPALIGLENDWVQSDAGTVAELRRALDRSSS